MSKKKKITMKAIKTSRTHATKLYRYKDDSGFTNNVTTVVLGSYTLEGHAIDEFNHDRDILSSALSALEYDVTGCTKGIAVVSPTDVYDEKAGREIASLRAELAGNIAARGGIKTAIATIDRMKALLNSEYDALNSRKETIKADIAEASDFSNKESVKKA